MSKITYLFGAGASCQAMPLVSNLPKRMKEMREILMRPENELSRTESFNFSDNYHKTKFDYQATFIKDLEELEIAAANHYTIDTYAKKLLATGKVNELFHLKLMLSSYFTLEQLSISGKCDNRYDSFWASLIGNSHLNMPDNVKILTWNYDIQMELSFSEYCFQQNLETAVHTLNIHVNNNRKNTLDSEGKFAVYKLNGTANFFLDLNQINYRNHFIYDDYKRGLTIDAIERIIQIYSIAKNLSNYAKIAPTLSFAWECPLEHTRNQTSFIKIIENEISDTEVLVVIGYSFPFFNRSVDRALVKSMTNLKKVYIQDIEPKEVIASFRSIKSDWAEDFNKRVEPILMKNQFFLPPEL